MIIALAAAAAALGTLKLIPRIYLLKVIVGVAGPLKCR